MADFRKLFIVLAVLAVVATSAFGQPFLCNATTVTQTMRGGGITELSGDINLACSGGTASGSTSTSFVVQIEGGASAITNNIASTVSTAEGGYLMSPPALLIVTDVSGNPVGVYQGYLQATAPTVALFPGVTLPTGTTEYVKITGLRVAAQQVASVTATIPVFATVSSTPTNVVSSSNPLLQIGTVYPALTMGLTDCSGTGSFSEGAFTQCVSQAAPSGSSGGLTFGVQFQEQTVTSAFRNKVEEGVDATQGTRLLATFTNIPAGVTIWVTDRAIGANSTATAEYVSGADATGSGGSYGTSSSGFSAVVCNGGVTNGAQLAKANNSGGVWYATWEVLSDHPTTIDTLVFGVMVSYSAAPASNLPGLTQTGSLPTLDGSFAPVSTDLFASSSDYIPRFQNTSLTAGPLFTIAPCITNLLFPYVTNTQGYDTGLAIVNTSADVFGTSSQTGACTLNFFGSPTVAAFTTPDVNPGTVYAQVLENVGAAGFEGYIIAQCDFQYGHGLAFIVNPGGVGTQYLALVIPNLGSGARPADPFPTAGAGSGEQLGE